MLCFKFPDLLTGAGGSREGAFCWMMQYPLGFGGKVSKAAMHMHRYQWGIRRGNYAKYVTYQESVLPLLATLPPMPSDSSDQQDP